MVACTAPLGIPIKEPGEIRPARDARIQYVACGKCMACRLTHAANWATRIVHEASLHDENCFATLTYSEEYLPDPPSVSRREMQLWVKRLRKELWPQRIRYFICGEYGTATKRPHYHAIIFGTAFRKDRYPWRNIRGNIYYRSPFLEATWPFGTVEISDVTPQSAGYVARYSVKKANDFNGADPYMRVNAQTGEIYSVTPEFLQMSNRPGIGFGWLDKFAGDAFPAGFLIRDGKKVPIPPAYKRRIKEHHEQFSDAVNAGVDEVEQQRYERALETADDNTPERRAVKDELIRLRTQDLKRDLE